MTWTTDRLVLGDTYVPFPGTDFTSQGQDAVQGSETLLSVGATEVMLDAAAACLVAATIASGISRRSERMVVWLVSVALQTALYVLMAAFLGLLAYSGAQQPLALRIAEGVVVPLSAFRAALLATLTWGILTGNPEATPTRAAGRGWYRR